MNTVGFLRPNFADDYNQDINHADVANQLGLVYKTALNLHITKWWHAILFWAIDKAHTAGYKMHKCYHLSIQGKPLPHYVFQETNCLAVLQEETKQQKPRRPMSSQVSNETSSRGSRQMESRNSADDSSLTTDTSSKATSN